MAFELDTKRGVKNFYGPRTAYEGVVGELPTMGGTKELALEFSGASYSVTSGILPAGAKVIAAHVEVEEEFVLTGTTPTILIGTDGSEVTNGFVISETQAEAKGLYVITSFAGTWANMLASNTTVGVAIGGTGGPAVTAAGKMRVVVRYALQ